MNKFSAEIKNTILKELFLSVFTEKQLPYKFLTNENWQCILFANFPPMNEDIFTLIKEIIKSNKEMGFIFSDTILRQKQEVITFSEDLSYELFEKIIETFYLKFEDCYLLGNTAQWGFYSNTDVNIAVLAISSKITINNHYLDSNDIFHNIDNFLFMFSNLYKNFEEFKEVFKKENSYFFECR